MDDILFPLIAFTGYGHAGKDEAAKPLIASGIPRYNFGDIIKRQLDPLIREHFGFSAFTENPAEKKLIRRTLESWGEDNYDRIFDEFFGNLPKRAVNTRLCRPKEAREWVSRGGIIVEVQRKGVGPETEWAERQVSDLRSMGLIHVTLQNNGTIEELHRQVKDRYAIQS